MTNYGAVPTSPSPVVDVESLTSDNQCNACAMPRRPWGVMLDFHSVGLPRSFSVASSRFNTNSNYFRMNYWIIVSIIFLIGIYGSLVEHPFSLIAFTVLIFLCIVLFYLQDDDEPIELFCCEISDWTIRIVKSCLILLGFALLILTNETYKIYSRPLTFVIGYVLILIHTVVRKTEDLFLEEEAARNETCWNSLGLHVMLAIFLFVLELLLEFGMIG